MNETEPDWLLQGDWIAWIEASDRSAQWSRVCWHEDGDWEHVAVFSAVIPSAEVEACLGRDTWDLGASGGAPGFVVSWEEGEEKATYLRYGRDDGVEPLVIRRDFHRLHPESLELCEEFRLLFNLYHDPIAGTYSFVTDEGTDLVVARETGEGIEVRTTFLRRYAAIKGAHVAILVDVTRYSPLSLEDMGLDSLVVERADEHWRYSLAVQPNLQPLPSRPYVSLSRLLGKFLLPRLPLKQCGVSPFDEEKKYIDFIIGEDAQGRPVEYSSDPDELGTYFDVDPGARPHYLTSVFFRRDVLTKYLSEPSRYEVRDGHLACGALWIVGIDNNHDDYIVAYLGDLGRDLPTGEQRYWRSFNVIPEGTLSSVAFRRDFLNQSTAPEAADLRFKNAYRNLRRSWMAQFGWDLYVPLAADDTHVLTTLHVPLNEDQSAFDAQILSLAKLMVDALNEQELDASLQQREADAKGIRKLELWLIEAGRSDATQLVDFLRRLQKLRSAGTAHLKGREYAKAVAAFGLGTTGRKAAFEAVLERAIIFMSDLLGAVGVKGREGASA